MMNMPAIQFDTSIHSFGSQNIFYHWITFLRNRMLLWRLPISILGHIRFKLPTHWQIFSGQFHFYDWSFIKCVMKTFHNTLFMLQYLKFHRVKQLNNPLYYRITLQERLLNILCLSSLLNSLNVIFDGHINESS